MEDLKKALEILLRLGGCGDMSAEHDVLYLQGRSPDELPEETVQELADLGCLWDEEYESWRVFT